MTEKILTPMGAERSAIGEISGDGVLTTQPRVTLLVRAWRMCELFWIPILSYGLFILSKLAGIDVGTDLPGAHAAMGAAFLLFGVSICYLMTILRHVAPFQSEARITSGFWVLATVLFFLLFCDATFGIHERLPAIGLAGYWAFLSYGAMLGVIVIAYFRTLHVRFFWIVAAFAMFSGAAVIGDAGARHEGIIALGGTEYSFEQAFETFSVLLLAAAFTSEALRDLSSPFSRLQNGAGDRRSRTAQSSQA